MNRHVPHPAEKARLTAEMRAMGRRARETAHQLGLMSAEQHAEWPIVVHAILWPALTVILSLLLIQPIKGAIVGLQWAMRMHGFAGKDDDENSHETGKREG